MLLNLFIIGINSLFILCVEQSLHLLSHNKKSGPLYRWHKLHHIDYPPNRVQSDKYINSGDSHIFENLFFYCIVLVQVIVYNLTSFKTFTMFFLQSSTYSILVNYFHIQYHLKNSYYNRYAWFRKRRDYHLLHHKNKKYNYAFLTNTFDKLSKTYIES